MKLDPILLLAALISSAYLIFSSNLLFQSGNNIITDEYVAFIKLQDGSFRAQESEAIFLNQKVKPPSTAYLPTASAVLSATTEEKWIDIDLSQQTLTAYEGEKPVYQFLVSTGRFFPTPTGTFRIWSKLRYTTMKGGSQALGTYYYLPNVPYTQFFYQGFALHGTYWHNNFGRPMSHGCVNLAIPDSEKLFYWTQPALDNKDIVYPASSDPGTKIVIHQ